MDIVNVGFRETLPPSLHWLFQNLGISALMRFGNRGDRSRGGIVAT